MKDTFAVEKENTEFSWVFTYNNDYQQKVINLDKVHDIFKNILNKKNPYFYLNCLYVIVGESIRTKGRIYDIEMIKNIVNYAKSIQNKEIQNWVNRSLELFKKPYNFNYTLWCKGQLVYNDIYI